MSESDAPYPIAFCITGLQPGGAERALVQIVTRLNRDRWAPVVYSLTGSGPLVEQLEQADIPIEVLQARSAWDARIIWHLAQKFKAQKPVLLQTFLFHANLAGRIAARLAHVPHVVAGIRVSEKRRNGHLLLDRLTNRLVELNICVSQSVADFSIKEGHLPADKVTVVPNGVEFQRFAGAKPADLSCWKIPEGAKVILSVGRLDPQKAPGDLLAAFLQFAAQAPEFHLLFVGDGPLKAELEQRASQSEFADRIHFAGWQPQIPELMRAADCLVLSSLWEGMPNVVLEAMAAGLPVISTKVDGIFELIQPGEQGTLVEIGSVDQLRRALVDLRTSPAQFLKMSENAQTLVEQEFTWESIAQKYDQIYSRILSLTD
ncbi:glycosyltransferase [Gimesia panareensis]|uniref:glycosyltransferase n=1 Tax=Gimesia panareensis TaxID=2527978 RepID=UPI001189CEBF|nr:glycosyltransferase [Gimesia panareensis]QDU49709.1 Putative glycosyltransferase EpsF [Gimesia panareensis]